MVVLRSSKGPRAKEGRVLSPLPLSSRKPISREQNERGMQMRESEMQCLGMKEIPPSLAGDGGNG